MQTICVGLYVDILTSIHVRCPCSYFTT